MSAEIWKAVDGWQGRYDVSSAGRVRSWFYGVKHLTEPRILAQKIDKYGYPCVSFHWKDIKESHTVHRLVAIAFIPNHKNLPQINHIDGNKQNNNVDNLEWCTNKENITHAFENGLISKKNMSEAQKRRYEKPSERAKKSEISKALWKDESFREKILTAFGREEYKEKLRKARSKHKPPTLNTKRINNGSVEKCVKVEQISNYLGDGWSLGRLPRLKKGG